MLLAEELLSFAIPFMTRYGSARCKRAKCYRARREKKKQLIIYSPTTMHEVRIKHFAPVNMGLCNGSDLTRHFNQHSFGSLMRLLRTQSANEAIGMLAFDVSLETGRVYRWVIHLIRLELNRNLISARNISTVQWQHVSRWSNKRTR